MPELNGCHVPELWGTKRPSPGCQAPVDNFSRSTGIFYQSNAPHTPTRFELGGTKCPNGSHLGVGSGYVQKVVTPVLRIRKSIYANVLDLLP